MINMIKKTLKIYDENIKDLSIIKHLIFIIYVIIKQFNFVIK